MMNNEVISNKTSEGVIVLEPANVKRSRKTKTIIRLIYVIAILFLLYFPIFIIMFQSFNKDSTGIEFGGFTLKWYQELFKDDKLMMQIFYTISVAVLSTVISTIFGTLTAIGINSLTRKNRKRMIILNNVPVLNADIATGIFLFLIFKTFGVIIGKPYILGFGTLLISHIFFSVPYIVLSVLPKLNEIDSNLYDAAVDLGCKPSKALLRVIIPSIKSAIFTGALLAFTMSIDDFVISYFTSGSGIGNFSTWLYTNRKMGLKYYVWPKAYAYNTIISVITLSSLVIYNIVKNVKIRKKKIVKNY